MAVAVVVYVWLVSAGTVTQCHTYTDYYDQLARGFLRGQVSLIEQPAPALLKLPDPYDPSLNEGLRLHDASLYRGHYYLYWGPCPAALLAIIRLLPIPSGVKIGDQYLVFAFAIGLLLFNALLLLRIRRIIFPDQPPWTVGIALLAAAFAAPVVYLIGRASIYEAAIMGGQCFLIAGFYFAFRGLEIRARRGWIFAAGIAWGCAIACRFNLIAPIAGVALLMVWRLFRVCSQWKQRWISVGLFVTPLILFGSVLLAYNQARFGSPFEFGTRYQLTWLNGFGAPPANVLFSMKYVEPNLDRMWLEPMEIVPRFPFLRCAKANPRRMIREYHLPREYFPEPLAGLATSLPFAYLAIIAPIILAWRMRRRGRVPAIKTVLQSSETPDRDSPAGMAGQSLLGRAGGFFREPGQSAQRNWLCLSFLASTLFSMASIVFVLASTMRYLADVAPSLILLAAMGMWLANEKSHASAGRFNIVLAGALLLAIAEAIIGVLLAAPPHIQ